MAVSRRLRFEVLRRDGYTCRYCGAQAPDAKLTVDHVIPVALGGGDEPSNLITACVDCNAGKSSIPADAALVEDVDAASLLWAKAIEKAVAIREQESARISDVLDWFYRAWDDYRVDGDKVPLPHDWTQSVTRFYGLGLDELIMRQHIVDAMHATMVPVNKVFNSFCRRCWDEITERQELARRLIEDGEV